MWPDIKWSSLWNNYVDFHFNIMEQLSNNYQSRRWDQDIWSCKVFLSIPFCEGIAFYLVNMGQERLLLSSWSQLLLRRLIEKVNQEIFFNNSFLVSPTVWILSFSFSDWALAIQHRLTNQPFTMHSQDVKLEHKLVS